MREAINMAVHAILSNKLRTFLSLLGITIGIFSVISILTIFDSLENKIRSSLDEFGSNVLFIQKWPWAMGGDNYAWWEYIKRPQASLRETNFIKEKSKYAESVAYYVASYRSIRYKANSNSSAAIIAVSQDYDKILPQDIVSGRYFTANEIAKGSPVAIIGNDIVEKLFENEAPIGKQITISGIKTEVIGIFKKDGTMTVGQSNDRLVMVPINFGRIFIDLKSKNAETSIMVKAKEGVTLPMLKSELQHLMKNVRKIKPNEKDNFAINETSFLTNMFDKLFSVLSMVGWVIGGFSLLVGGFGIANIMFVSVKERTSQIGIQKALGAKSYFILTEFLTESVFLSVLGGIFGLIVIYGFITIASYLMDFELVLSLKNIAIGILVSAAIGLLSGIFPAWNAAKLDPVEAMRTSF